MYGLLLSTPQAYLSVSYYGIFSVSSRCILSPLVDYLLDWYIIHSSKFISTL